MPSSTSSFLAGRNRRTLTEKDITRVITTFSGFEREINAHYEPESPTLFRIKTDEYGQEYGDVGFGNDIFPGIGIVDSNSALSINAAIAHEVSHYHRWKNKNEIDATELTNLDEALTSLEAVRRFPTMLNSTDIQGLVADAIQRIILYIEELDE